MVTKKGAGKGLACGGFSRRWVKNVRKEKGSGDRLLGQRWWGVKQNAKTDLAKISRRDPSTSRAAAQRRKGHKMDLKWTRGVPQKLGATTP